MNALPSQVLSELRRTFPGLRRMGGRRAPSPPHSVAGMHLPVGDGPARLDYLTRAAREHGDVVRFDFPVLTAHLCSHPDHVQQMLVDEHRIFTKQTRGYRKLKEFLGNGLVTSEGDFWKRQRRIANPAFHKRRIEGFAESMVRATNAMLVDWEKDAKARTPIDVSAEMMRLTMRIAGETLLSTDPSDHASAVGTALRDVLHEANDVINRPWSPPRSWPTARNKRFHAATGALDGIVLGIIEERRRGGAPKDDLLQMLLEARDEETGEGMSDKQLRDEVMTMFLAGHETTSNALTWAFYLLSRFPAVARALHEEAANVLGDRDATYADVPKLELARRVLNEAMRLYPPVWIMGRSPSEDVEIGGYPNPANSLVFTRQWVIHRHPAFWEDPEGFDPDRWRPERAKTMHRYQYFPFAAGPRMCIGAGFAQMEGQLLLATIARKFRLDLVPGHSVEPEPLVTLRPKHGVLVTLHRR